MNIRRVLRTITATGLLSITAACVLPAAASAEVSCTYNPDLQSMSISMTEVQDSVDLKAVSVNGVMRPLYAHDGSPLEACGDATLANTNQVIVSGVDPSYQELTIHQPENFVGDGDEGDAVDEVEIIVNLGNNDNDKIVIKGSDADEKYFVAAGGIAVGGENEIDIQTSHSTIEVLGLGGADELRADGLADFPSPRQTYTILRGGDGDDLLAPTRAANSNIVGGDGKDRITFSRMLSAVHADLGAGTFSFLALDNTMSQIEHIVGTPFDDILRGNGAGNNMVGGDGDDTIYGLAGNDWMSGGDGEDTVDGGANNDTVGGSAGADELTGGSGVDTVNGSDGADRFFVQDGVKDTVNGGAGSDSAKADASDRKTSVEKKI